MNITKERVLQQWEEYYAKSVLQMEKDGLFISEIKSHTRNKEKLIRIHPAFKIFQESSQMLSKFNQWNTTDDQIKLDLNY